MFAIPKHTNVYVSSCVFTPHHNVLFPRLYGTAELTSINKLINSLTNITYEPSSLGSTVVYKSHLVASGCSVGKVAGDN